MSNKINGINDFQIDTQKGRFLTFTLGKEIFALEIKYVTEIVEILSITPIPEVPKYIKGIINLRGKIISVIDMRIKLKMTPSAYSDKTCIIVVDTEDSSIGLIVDNVAEVVTILDEQIIPPPDCKNGDQNGYIQAVGMVENKVILLLDCFKLLFYEDTHDTYLDKSITIE